MQAAKEHETMVNAPSIEHEGEDNTDGGTAAGTTEDTITAFNIIKITGTKNVDCDRSQPHTTNNGIKDVHDLEHTLFADDHTSQSVRMCNMRADDA